jgi:hypothetical protein
MKIFELPPIWERRYLDSFRRYLAVSKKSLSRRFDYPERFILSRLVITNGAIVPIGHVFTLAARASDAATYVATYKGNRYYLIVTNDS